MLKAWLQPAQPAQKPPPNSVPPQYLCCRRCSKGALLHMVEQDKKAQDWYSCFTPNTTTVAQPAGMAIQCYDSSRGSSHGDTTNTLQNVLSS
jgi:hypothetical protein